MFLWTGSRDAKAGLPQLKNARIPIFYTPDKLARGLASRLAYHTWRERRLVDGFAAAPPRTTAQDAAIARAFALGRPTLWSPKANSCRGLGRGSAREHLVTSAGAATVAAERIRYPVALKVDSPDILHKTEAGVVRLNLRDAAQVRTAFAEIVASAKAHAPQARIAGVSVQEMVRDGVEVIVGVSYDPQLGPVLLFGRGGVMVEVYNDVALRRCPITHAEAEAMITQVNGARLSTASAADRRPTSRHSRTPWCASPTSPCTSKDLWRSWTSTH